MSDYPNSVDWYYVGKTSDGWHAYQQTQGNFLLPRVTALQQYIPALSYRQWVEQQEGRPWAEIAKQYEGVAR